HPVDETVFDADRILLGFIKCRSISDGCRIEDNHVSEHPFLNVTTTVQPKVVCRQAGQATDRLRE
ncbi:MAG: hypothetical protein ACREBC_19910, partial [Pyrinomonadaceae bacterium]